MKVLKKIGLGIISLGLISTFYIPEAKAGNLTLSEFTVPSFVPTTGGRKYAIKMVTSSTSSIIGKIFLKRVGSGNKDCQMWLTNEAQFVSFIGCVEAKRGTDLFNDYMLEEYLYLKNQ